MNIEVKKMGNDSAVTIMFIFVHSIHVFQSYFLFFSPSFSINTTFKSNQRILTPMLAYLISFWLHSSVFCIDYHVSIK